ncbi:MAG: hypothetical protein L6R38_004643 [Xanthoria sp. 2 TBL-2021]|nr:MAG: hypothetical protein L6R38_004643 [Xanthoria sp. 2 TBL-2021]
MRKSVTLDEGVPSESLKRDKLPIFREPQAGTSSQRVIPSVFAGIPTWTWPRPTETKSSASTFAPLKHRALHHGINHGIISLIEDQGTLDPSQLSPFTIN